MNALTTLERELASGERLLWSGQPKPGLIALLGGADHTVYGLTDRRILVVLGSTRKVRSIEWSKVADILLEERPDGSGDLRFISIEKGYVKVVKEQKLPIPTGEIFASVPRVREAFEAAQRARAICLRTD